MTTDTQTDSTEQDSNNESTSTQDTTKKKKSNLSNEELKELQAFSESNIIKDGSYKFTAADDIWTKAATSPKSAYWQLSEEVFLYTFHDKQKHRYLQSFQIDSDKNDICTTCSFEVPFNEKLIEYWVPGQTSFALIGGTYDREVLFIGRCSECNQSGDSLEIVGQNIGWKFKQYMKQSTFDKLNGMTVHNAVKYLFKELGFEKGRYHINLSGIPNIDDYVISEDGTIKKSGKTIDRVPDLEFVIGALKQSHISSEASKRVQTHDTQTVANNYDEKRKIRALDNVYATKSKYTPYSFRKNVGVSTSFNNNEISYDPIEANFFNDGDDGDDWFIEGESYDGEQTYEDVLHNIASAIDAHFYIVDTTVCFVSFDALFAMDDTVAVQKSICPNIDLWQIEDDSFVVDVNQYGYYNTVKVNYNGGSVTVAYDDLVRIYGEVLMEYNEPELDYNAASLKAQAYLSANVRDFGMTLQCTILHSGKIIPSTFVKLKNPLTMSEGLYYVFGSSIHWNGDGDTIYNDLDLRYGPENPDDPEVPEVGMGYTGSGEVYSGDVPADVAAAAEKMIMGATDPTIKGQRVYGWVDANVAYLLYYNCRYPPSQLLNVKIGNCYDQAHLIYELCTAVGVKCEIHAGTYRFIGSTYPHFWNKIEQNGQMVFADTGFGLSNTIKRNPIGSYHGGKPLSDRLVKKNY